MIRTKILALLIAVSTCSLAWGIPRIIPDGTEHLSGLQLKAARDVTSILWTGVYDNDLETLSTTRVSVVYLADPPYLRPDCPAQAVVLRYTLFGLS